MAVSGSGYLREKERFWFSTRVTGSTNQMPLNELKRTYWTAQSLTGTYAMQERLWLKKIITDNGATPSATNSVATLLKEALSALAVTPTIRQTENWMTLYGRYNP